MVKYEQTAQKSTRLPKIRDLRRTPPMTAMARSVLPQSNVRNWHRSREINPNRMTEICSHTVGVGGLSVLSQSLLGMPSLTPPFVIAHCRAARTQSPLTLRVVISMRGTAIGYYWASTRVSLWKGEVGGEEPESRA